MQWFERLSGSAGWRFGRRCNGIGSASRGLSRRAGRRFVSLERAVEQGLAAIVYYFTVAI